MCVDERILKTGDHGELGADLQTISIDLTLRFFVHFLNQCTKVQVQAESGILGRDGSVDVAGSTLSFQSTRQLSIIPHASISLNWNTYITLSVLVLLQDK